MPRRMALSIWRVMSRPSRSTIQAFEEAPSVTWPLSSTNQASFAPSPRAASLASEAGSSITVLMSQRAQRVSGMVLMAMPAAAAASSRAGDTAARQADDGRLHVVGREQEVARARAARDLQVDEPVAHAVAPDGLAHHARPGARRHRLGDAELGQRAGQALHVPRLVDQPAAPHLAHLVDRIAELEAAVLGVHARLRVRADTGR